MGLIVLFLGAAHVGLCGAGQAHSWIAGECIKLTAAGPVPVKEGADIAMGQPAFRSLSVKKVLMEEKSTGEKERWIISGTVISTNAIGTMQGVPIYVGRDDELPMLVAMSNFKGEILFEASAIVTKDGKRVMPNRIYIAFGLNISGGNLAAGSFVRRYTLQPGEFR